MLSRLIAIGVGLVFVLVLMVSFFSGAKAYIVDPPVKSVESRFHLEPKDVHFASDGSHLIGSSPSRM